MLIKEYKDYLIKASLAESTIKVYTGKIQQFLDKGYSEADLLGAVDQLIRQYSAGGQRYNPKDSGNTLAALNKLKEYKLVPYLDSFYISYEKGWSSFVVKGENVTAYTISNCNIKITYSEGFSASKTKEKCISKKKFFQLIDIIIKNKGLLADSDTAIKTVHGPIATYSYYLDDKYNGTNCNSLFNDSPKAALAVDEYQAWLNQYI